MHHEIEDSLILESAEQVLRIVAAAIDHELTSKEQGDIGKKAARQAKAMAVAKALPGTLDESTAAELFASCYPLHPVSALLLPILCQKGSSE
ncbi:MAG: hypothetical protein RNU03_10160 [Candidatus Sedimenticola sp. (ex Thyasira tokunagai)]